MPGTDLAHRAGVELVNVGSWQLLSGSWNPNREDILAAVDAAQCPAVRRPKLKLGHLDPRFNEPDEAQHDGTPSLGWFDNLRASDDGNTLIGDQVALPWLNAVQAAAYPDRSIEGTHNARCALGHVHPFVITAVSLLGETPPGIPTLKSIKSVDDLPAALGVAASGQATEGGEDVQATVRAAAEPAPDGDGDEDDEPTGAMVALVPTVDDAARLAVAGGEPAEQLHVTLAYLGEAADLGAQGQQDVIAAVSAAVNGLPQVSADIFSVNVFNPASDNAPVDAADRDTCLVWGLSGDEIDAVHDLIGGALAGMGSPAQHRPWHAHMTAVYSDDLTLIPDLAGRVGPVTFDRVRIAFAGLTFDIPLIGPDGAATQPALGWAGPVAASAEPGLPADPASELPAAEPEQPITEPKEDPVSDLSAFRSRLGLTDDADEQTILSALDALKTKADTPATAEPTAEMVAASAAATVKAEQAEQEKDELRKEVQILASQMKSVSDELAATKAKEAATVKASVFDAAIKEGKIKPADRVTWEHDYDEAPNAVARVLASIAVGTAVPVTASGVAGTPEPDSTDDWDAIVARLDGPHTAKAV